MRAKKGSAACSAASGVQRMVAAAGFREAEVRTADIVHEAWLRK